MVAGDVYVPFYLLIYFIKIKSLSLLYFVLYYGKWQTMAEAK